MLDRLNQIMDSWESRNRRSHWVSTVAKGLLSFGVAAGAVAATSGSADAASCACSNPSCSSCHRVTTFSPAWWCNDSNIGCCSISHTKDCWDSAGRWQGHCGGTRHSFC